MGTVAIEIRNVYGRLKAYPKCDNGRTFASMLGTKTLTRVALEHIQQLGYRVITGTGAVQPPAIADLD